MDQQPMEQVPQPAQQQTQPQATEDPGRTFGILGLVFAFLLPIVGLILSIIARSKSKAAGMHNSLATVGIILSIVFLVINIPLALSLGFKAFRAADETTKEVNCAELSSLARGALEDPSVCN